MDRSDQDVLEDLAEARVRVAQILAMLTDVTGRAYHAKNRLARLWWEWRVIRLDDKLAKADDVVAYHFRIARRRGLLPHRSARAASFSEHF